MSTGELASKGLTEDGFVTWNIILTKCEGEFWGVTKTNRLCGGRFNEKLRGSELTVHWGGMIFAKNMPRILKQLRDRIAESRSRKG